MKVVFVYPDFMKGAQGKYYEGIASLSAALKEKGHAVTLLHLTRLLSDAEFATVFRKNFSDAELAGFSSTTNVYPFVAGYAAAIKKIKDIPVICGGTHPTLSPEDAIAASGVDMICVGEGEVPLAELCGRLEKKQRCSDIPGLWVKENGVVIRNSPAAVIEDLARLPKPDRSIFDYEHSLDHQWRRLVFMASRGCPFNCAHCCNNKIKQVYPSDSKYVRFKSVTRIIDEIKDCLRQWHDVRQILFHDDILTLNKVWFNEFASRYKQEIGLPYVCNSRFDLLDADTLGKLKDSGCVGVKLGLESGCDHIRKEVLNRKQEQRRMIETADLCRTAGIPLYTFNMVGIPFEDMSRALETVKLNARIKPYDMQVSILYPYPTTDLYEVCRQNGFLTGKTLLGYVERDTILKLDSFTREDILFAYDHFVEFIEYYEFASLFPGKFGTFLVRVTDHAWYHHARYYGIMPVLFLMRMLYKVIRKLKITGP